MSSSTMQRAVSFSMGTELTSEPGQTRYPKRKRADIQYNYEDVEDDEPDSELEYVPVKRQRKRPTKPPPKHKIFPFLSLPAEIRNKIYEECLPSPTKLPKGYHEDNPAIWLASRQKSYRRTIVYRSEIEEHEGLYDYYPNRYSNHRRFGTHRGHVSDQQSNNEHDCDSDAEEDESGPRKLGLSILSACKQIYEEAAPMMYAQSLVFTDVDALFAFAATLSPRTAKLLRSIEIRSWGLTRSRKTRGYIAISMLAAKGVTNLDTLFINCTMGYYRSWGGGRSSPVPKRIARKVYRDCHLWLEAVGAASGDMYKGVEILKLNGSMHDSSTSWEEIPEEDMKMYKKELRRLLRQGA